MALPFPHFLMLVVMGGAFLLAGLGVFLWARRAESRYYDSLSGRPDLLEFMERSSDRPGYRALRLGGLIAIIVGAVLLGIAGGLRLWG